MDMLVNFFLNTFTSSDEIFRINWEHFYLVLLKQLCLVLEFYLVLFYAAFDGDWHGYSEQYLWHAANSSK